MINLNQLKTTIFIRAQDSTSISNSKEAPAFEDDTMKNLFKKKNAINNKYGPRIKHKLTTLNSTSKDKYSNLNSLSLVLMLVYSSIIIEC